MKLRILFCIVALLFVPALLTVPFDQPPREPVAHRIVATPRTPTPPKTPDLSRIRTPRPPTVVVPTDTPEPTAEAVERDTGAVPAECGRAPGPFPRGYCAGLMPIILDAWTLDDAWAERVVNCESVNLTDFHNPSGARGPWQFIPSTWSRVLGQSGTPFDHSVTYQTQQAERLYHIQGPGAWVCH